MRMRGTPPSDAVPPAQSLSRRLQAPRRDGRCRGSPAAQPPPRRVTLAAGHARFGAAQFAACGRSGHATMQDDAPQVPAVSGAVSAPRGGSPCRINWNEAPRS